MSIRHLVTDKRAKAWDRELKRIQTYLVQYEGESYATKPTSTASEVYSIELTYPQHPQIKHVHGPFETEVEARNEGDRWAAAYSEILGLGPVHKRVRSRKQKT
jgi:hypothetical protein